MRGWIIAVVSAALAAALLRVIPGKGGAGRVTALAGGALLLITMLQPLAGADPAGLVEEMRLSISAARENGESLTEDTKKMMEQLIVGECEAYVQKEGERLGILCRAEISCALSEEGLPIPDRVTVRTEGKTEAIAALAQRIEEDLGIPPERQTYREG